ncbi:hypothetical protein ACWEO1_24805 [Kitasatospora cineracea]
MLDNYATHETPAIKTWLVAHPRSHLHVTPTGSSWLNPVGRWFAELANQRIRRGVHKPVQAFETDIRDWTATRNTDPKPHVWTRTADEILERLAGYPKRIPDSGHSGPETRVAIGATATGAPPRREPIRSDRPSPGRWPGRASRRSPLPGSAGFWPVRT